MHRLPHLTLLKNDRLIAFTLHYTMIILSICVISDLTSYFV